MEQQSVTVTEKTLEEIDYIINNFSQYFVGQVTDLAAVAVCLQFLLDGKAKLTAELKGMTEDD